MRGNILSKIPAGCSYFFNKYSDFKPTYVECIGIWDRPFFNFRRDESDHVDMFLVPNVSKDNVIELALKEKISPIRLCIFLAKEYLDTLDGFTIDDLKKLQPLRDKLTEKKHMYLCKIYDFYLENNDFSLTDEQLDEVYKEYKK